MEINVGDYVRTPLGIAKYLGKYNMAGNTDDWYEFDKLDENLWFGDIANVIYKNQFDEVVLKSSPNIIDLIEEGDYVNGRIVCCFRKDNCDYDIGFSYNDDWGEWYGIDADEVKSVITHEQMESVVYKVGE